MEWPYKTVTIVYLMKAVFNDIIKTFIAITLSILKTYSLNTLSHMSFDWLLVTLAMTNDLLELLVDEMTLFLSGMYLTCLTLLGGTLGLSWYIFSYRI